MVPSKGSEPTGTVNTEGYSLIILSADIGGTNANFTIVGFKNGRPEVLFSRRENSSSVPHFCQLVNNFLARAKEEGFEPTEGCFAVAGPVEEEGGNRLVRMTNAGLVVDTQELLRRTPLKQVEIMNDFEAISYAINLLQERDFVTLSTGREVKGGTRVVIGAGTGLGKSILYWHGWLETYVPISSEGGHGDLPLLSEEELRLSAFIRKRSKIVENVVYEDVLSGRGLQDIYQYLNDSKFPDSPAGLSPEEISETKKSNPCSRETFRWFVEFYARCARNFALDALATGGLYVAGGIAARNPDSFADFTHEFIKNDAYRRILERIPVHIVTNYDVSPIGAAHGFMVRQTLKRGRPENGGLR